MPSRLLLLFILPLFQDLTLLRQEPFNHLNLVVIAVMDPLASQRLWEEDGVGLALGLLLDEVDLLLGQVWDFESFSIETCEY